MPTPLLRLLLCPLHWGLGHATRSLPLADALRAAAAEVGRDVAIHWASDGDAIALLRRERPDDSHHELPTYGVRYPTRSALLNMALSGPRMLAAIGREARAVRELHARYDFDLVISDNRYGCRVPGVRNLFVTHQVHLPIGGLAGRASQTLHNAWIGGFDEVVIPDYPTAPRLAGEMSVPPPRMAATYLGPVSRFAQALPTDGYEDNRVVCLLSGPEPARTALEHLLYERLDRPALLIRGTTRPAERRPPAHVEVRDLLVAGDLRAVLAQAPLLITRPGYTTVMDLAVLGLGAVFVPTPGQPEQERLGRSLAAGGRGVTVAQDELRVPGVLANALAHLMSMTSGSPTGGLAPKPHPDALHAWARREVSLFA